MKSQSYSRHLLPTFMLILCTGTMLSCGKSDKTDAPPELTSQKSEAPAVNETQSAAPDAPPIVPSHSAETDQAENEKHEPSGKDSESPVETEVNKELAVIIPPAPPEPAPDPLPAVMDLPQKTIQDTSPLPVLAVSPMNGAQIAKSETWLFWNPAPQQAPEDSLYYKIELSDTPDFAQAQAHYTAESDWLLRAVDWPMDGPVFWRVTTINRAQLTSAATETRQLDFIDSASLPAAPNWNTNKETTPVANPASQSKSGGFLGMRARWAGEYGMQSEAYRISGRDSRKPGGFTRWFLRPSLIINDRLRISTDLMFTTEDRIGRLDRNHYRVDLDWGNGGAQLGDFSRNWDSSILSGLIMRGANLDHSFSDKLQAGILYGKRQGTERVRTFETPDYDRQFLGARLALGDADSHQLELLGLHSKDLLGTLSTMELLQDTTEVDTLAFPFDSLAFPEGEQLSVSARENLVTMARLGTGLAGNKLRLKAQLSQSRITDDRLSAESGESSPFDFLMSDRLSTREAQSARLDLAWMARQNLKLSAGYSQVDPGYTSLGLAASNADRRELRLGLDTGLGNFRLRSSYSQANDNLDKSKALRTDRSRMRHQLRHDPKGNWNSSYSLSLVSLSNDGSGDEGVDSRLLSLGSRQNWLIARKGLLQSFGLDYTFQQSSEGSAARQNNAGDSHNASVFLKLKPAEKVALIPAINLIQTDIGGNSRRTIIPGISARHSAWERRLVNRLSLNWAFSENDNRLKLNWSTLWKASSRDKLKLQLKSSRFLSDLDSSKDYDEITVGFSWIRSFH